MSDRRPTCALCIFWKGEQVSSQPTTGHCHRYPPGVFANPQSGTVVQKFPVTERSQWCGEWNGDDGDLAEAVHRAMLKHAREATAPPGR